MPSWHFSRATTTITAPTSSTPIDGDPHRARHVLIANAYFFPGYRLLRDLRRAASRGVTVQLILQSHPDAPIVRFSRAPLYDILLKDGVTIHEYCRRTMHGKVAVVDDIWTTVGSSNLDPLSLSLNLEANVLTATPNSPPR